MAINAKFKKTGMTARVSMKSVVRLLATNTKFDVTGDRRAHSNVQSTLVMWLVMKGVGYL